MTDEEVDVQNLHLMWDTMDDVLVDAMKQGFYPLTSPPYQMPMMSPEVLVQFHPSQYAIIYAQMEGWKSYTGDQLAIIEGGILQCDNEMEDIVIMLRKEILDECERTKEKKPPDTSINSMIKSTPRYRQLKLKLQQLKQSQKLLQSHFDRLGRGMSMLSRYIEVKKIEEGNMGRRGM
jgi:hypothetical protein